MVLENPDEHLIHVFNSTLHIAKERYALEGDSTGLSQEAYVYQYLQASLFTISRTFKDLATYENSVERRNEFFIKAEILNKISDELRNIKEDEMEFFIVNHNDKMSTDIINNIRVAKSRVFLTKP